MSFLNYASLVILLFANVTTTQLYSIHLPLHHEVSAVDAEVPVVGGAGGSVVVLRQGLLVGRRLVGCDPVQHGTGLRHVGVVHDGHGVKSEVIAFLRPGEAWNVRKNI